MSALPITFGDKVNSPELLAFLQQYGPEKYITAEELNQIRDAINELFSGEYGDVVIESTGFTKDGENITFNPVWEWLINSEPNTNPAEVVVNIPLTASGMERIDFLCGNDANTFVRVAGTESEDNPIAPDVPENMVYITFVIVNDSEVSEPEPFELSGTLNYIQKITGPNALGNSQILDNGVSIGIGTSTPGVYKVHIVGSNGSGSLTSQMIENTHSSGFGANQRFKNVLRQYAIGLLNTPGSTKFSIYDVTAGLERLSIFSDGRITLPTLTIALINSGGAKSAVTKEYLDAKTSKTFPISADLTLSNTHNNGVIILTADANLTIPATGLIDDWECNVIVRPSIDLGFILAGGVTAVQNDGLTMTGKGMMTIKKEGATNVFNLLGI